ncbi:diaminopimelate epimerase [Hyphobacterium marinum]|uniref:Diaminopimelate epimerase n=1 Tax=Hyphobacterium marinum TaxID=3116574 RepID=A0ABU7LVD9_9PROT|nr:diaminopimelate epimerase [Hyphobacterium sp. Y6023]MEE2565534.1 diaminopimelate epimerase [Hyphobacterium sp. Y6023]
MPAWLMNGAGNAFLVIDVRGQAALAGMGGDQVRGLAARHGFDQFLIISDSDRGDAHMGVINADGSPSGACGNGARCVAWHVMEGLNTDRLVLDSDGGLMEAERTGDWRVRVDLGPARTGWQDIPLAREMDTVSMDLSVEAGRDLRLSSPGAVSMGNPHCVFFVENAETVPARAIGHRVEHDPLFPERVNVGFAQILDEARIRLRVWERGAGLTLACGTGAAAALVAAARRGLTGRATAILADGGELQAVWRDDGHVTVEGPVALTGEIDWPA